jgi:CRISPR/Cas system-associated exonuclease Cas4 (RecB family)
MRLSYSRLSAYLKCPYRYYLQYVEGFRPPANALMSFGGSLHAALRDFYSQEKFPPTLDDFYAHYYRNWTSFGFRNPEMEAKYFQEGLSILEEYYDRNIEKYRPAFFVEWRFQVEIKGASFVGIVDRIDRIGDRDLRVVDYKTYGRNGADSLQLMLYHLALEKIFGYPPQELLFYFLKEQEIFPISAEQEHLERAQEILLKTKEEIERGIFPKNRGENCSSCDFQQFCELEEKGFLEEGF